MRKRIVYSGVAMSVFVVLFLLMQRKARKDEHQGDDKPSAGLVSTDLQSGVFKTSKYSGALPSGLAAAYAPGVIVITNGVLDPDPRHNFNPGPNMPDHEGWGRYRQEMQTEARRGAEGKVTFHVVDTDGNSVVGAEIWVGFFGNPAVKGMTDENGLFTSEGKTLHGASVSYNITKHGFYRTRAFYQLGKQGYRCLENGRWIPWNPTLRVTLKEIRKPIPMYVKCVSLPMPVQSQPIGFDFEAGDWVAPYGKGIFSDIRLAYTWTTGEGVWRRHDFVVDFSNPQDGAYVVKKDEYCPFISEYEARQDFNYANHFQYVYERTSDKIIQDSKLSEHDIMVFRVRSETNEQGKIVKASYGKIYGPLKFAQGPKKLIEFTYYFNPTPNDRNLEFDGKNNLFDPAWRDLSWPK